MVPVFWSSLSVFFRNITHSSCSDALKIVVTGLIELSVDERVGFLCLEAAPEGVACGICALWWLAVVTADAPLAFCSAVVCLVAAPEGMTRKSGGWLRAVVLRSMNDASPLPALSLCLSESVIRDEGILVTS